MEMPARELSKPRTRVSSELQQYLVPLLKLEFIDLVLPLDDWLTRSDLSNSLALRSSQLSSTISDFAFCLLRRVLMAALEEGT